VFLRRWVSLFAVLLMLSQAVLAQTGEWAVLRQLLPGQKVKVETSGGKSYVGSVQSVTDDLIQLGKNDVIGRADVQRVLLWSPGHHGRNALIGLGIGAGFGVAAGLSCGKDAIVSKGQCMAVGAPFFGGVGAGIGALLPSHGKWHEVYLREQPRVP
jgi:hypothetical protein